MWSVILVFVTIAVHVGGLALISLAMPRFLAEITDDVRHRKSFFDTVFGTLVAITVIVLILAFLHVLEALIWGTAYFRLGVLAAMGDSFLYSLGAMSTAGSGLNVPVQWRFMGAIESFDGMLLFGISTAFIFAIMSRLWVVVDIHRGSK